MNENKVNKRFSKQTESLQGELKKLFYTVVFNIYLNDLFFAVDFTESCIFSDNITFFARDKRLESLIYR